MDWLTAPEWWWGRLILERGLAAVYLVAFVCAARQFRGLIGTPRHAAGAGIPGAPVDSDPPRACSICATPTASSPPSAGPVRRSPPRWSAGLADAVPVWGAMLLWLVLWVLYLSIVNVGQIWYSFGWESLTLEAGLLVVFVGNDDVAAAGARHVADALAAVPRRVRRRADQAARRPLLARPHLSGLPPRDATDARPAQLVLPSPAAAVAPRGGGRQSLRAARRPVRVVRSATDRRCRRARSSQHPAVARPVGQLRVAELVDDRPGRSA